MITAIKNISFSNIKKLDNKLQANNAALLNNNPPLRASSFLTNNISFLGNLNSHDDFDKTVEYNYFSLPKVKLDDGTTYQIKPDKFQLECARRIYNGDSTIFEASTGAGKTAIAHYAVNKNNYEDKQTIITVPLVSLANDKYREFSKIYGKDSVGLLTSSNKINPNAPILIEVTEILRNQAQSLEERKDEIGTIIFDEAHYIGDSDRGAVWENSIISAVPKGIQTVYLSATLGNGKEFASWVKKLNPNQKVSRVEANVQERFVPLTYSVYNPNSKGKEDKFISVIDGKVNLQSINENNLTDRQKRALEEIFKTQNNKNTFYEMSSGEFISTLRNLKIKLGGFNKEEMGLSEFEEKLSQSYQELDKSQIEKISQLLVSDKEVKKVHVAPLEQNDYSKLVEDLRDDSKLPALIFKLSQKSCDGIVSSLSSEENGVDLTNDDEKQKIKEIIKEYQDKGVYLGKNFNETALLKGVASHHAGKVPGYRKLVEDLFSKKLIKVVSATSTLSAGINMPVRTVVLSDVSYKKYNPETKTAEFAPLTASEFHQMAGRAGRRGVDSIGHVVLYNLYTDETGFFNEELNSKKKKAPFETTVPKDKLNFAYDLIASPADGLKSNFKPEPCMLANYYATHTTNDELKNEIAKSFRVHIARDSQKEIKNLNKKFENYSTILLKQGYITKDHKGEVTLTPKGKMLQQAMGANPLMLSSLIYDKKLDINPIQLCQIAGCISNTDNQEENSQTQELILERMAELASKDENKVQKVLGYQNANVIFQDTQDSIIKSTLEARVNPKEIMHSDSFGGLVGYMWADYNSKNSHNSIENFENLIDVALKPMEMLGTSAQDDPQFRAKAAFNRKAVEGNVYKILSQSVSVLKQIERMAEFALDNPEDYPETQYYEQLKENAQQAVKLIQKQPISDEIAV